MNENMKTENQDPAQATAQPSSGEADAGASASAPCFQPAPGETPRAFGAFMAFFNLGHARSLQAVADRLAEGLPTVKNWSCKYAWAERLQSFNAGLLRSSARDQAALQSRLAADWADRLQRFREQEWDAAQKLIAAAQCFLESFGEEDLRKMNLAQVSRALKISSAVGRLALAGAELPASPGPDLSPVQQQFLNAVKRLYGQNVSSPPSPPSSGPAVVNH
jgi:hypothetical protein